MLFPSYYRNNNSINQCDCAEVERLKDENLRLERERVERREQAIQEAREMAETRRRSASNWRQALEKQANLYAREAQLYPFIGSNGVDSFEISAEACEEAIRLWDEIQATKQAEIDELEAKIATLRDSVRIETCSRLRERYADKPGADDIESYVISPIEEGGDPEEWLNW